MTPGARLQAAIELLDQIASSRQPADQAIKAWGARNRYAGAKDRKAVADRVYRVLRQGGAEQGARARVLASLAREGLGPEEIAALFNGQGHAPGPLTAEEQAALGALDDGLPDFLTRELERSFGGDWRAELDALRSERAPLDIRINPLKANIQEVERALASAGIVSRRTPFSAQGLRLEGSPDLARLPQFEAGAFEVQDEASQLCAFLAGSGRPGLAVDYCAGGGGKTLALAITRPRLIACDVDAARLRAIEPRLARAGVPAELRRLGPHGEGLDDLTGHADLVLVDAPCSGSGVWRRRPEEASRLSRAELERLSALQREILDRACALVRPGGRLAYVTCSVLDVENGAATDAFAAVHADFGPLPIAEAAPTPLITADGQKRLAALAAGGHRLQLSPRRAATDGLFIALFTRTP